MIEIYDRKGCVFMPMTIEEYKEARERLWEALGNFAPNEDGNGNLKEGDLYKVNRVSFEDETEPKVLLKKMLGKQPTSAQRNAVLNAILGKGNVLHRSTISKEDSKFNKIWNDLVDKGAAQGAQQFIQIMVKEPKKETRDHFKSLLKEYLKKATKRTFDADGRNLYRGDRILCCLLLLHYMTKDESKLNVEITYNPDILSKNRKYFINQAAILLKNMCAEQHLNGVKAYFKQTFMKEKLEYYYVVLPSGWNGEVTSDFNRINKKKNSYEQLSTQYYNIARGINTASTLEDRLQITKFFVAAHFRTKDIVFAERDNKILKEIEKALFTGIHAVDPIKSGPDKEYITRETTNKLLKSIDELKGIFDESQMGMLRENVGKLNGQYIHAISYQGDKTYLTLLHDYERILEQMTMLKSLSPEKRNAFLSEHREKAGGMLIGTPLSRELVYELKKLNPQEVSEVLFDPINYIAKETEKIINQSEEFDDLQDSYRDLSTFVGNVIEQFLGHPKYKILDALRRNLCDAIVYGLDNDLENENFYIVDLDEGQFKEKFKKEIKEECKEEFKKEIKEEIKWEITHGEYEAFNKYLKKAQELYEKEKKEEEKEEKDGIKKAKKELIEELTQLADNNYNCRKAYADELETIKKGENVANVPILTTQLDRAIRGIEYNYDTLYFEETKNEDLKEIHLKIEEVFKKAKECKRYYNEEEIEKASKELIPKLQGIRERVYDRREKYAQEISNIKANEKIEIIKGALDGLSTAISFGSDNVDFLEGFGVKLKEEGLEKELQEGLCKEMKEVFNFAKTHSSNWAPQPQQPQQQNQQYQQQAYPAGQPQNPPQQNQRQQFQQQPPQQQYQPYQQPAYQAGGQVRYGQTQQPPQFTQQQPPQPQQPGFPAGQGFPVNPAFTQQPPQQGQQNQPYQQQQYKRY